MATFEGAIEAGTTLAGYDIADPTKSPTPGSIPMVARLGDLCTGHPCWPSRPNVEASTNVIVNGRGWHRMGDAWAVHCCAGDCHPGILAMGSKTVRVNLRPAGRIGDPVNCGSKVLTGSPTVICGG